MMPFKQKLIAIALSTVLMIVGLLGMTFISLAGDDIWTRKADMPTAKGGFSTSAVNGKIYAIGGWWGGSVVEEYDPVTDTWTKKANMPTARASLSTSAVNGKIYAIGGWGTGGDVSTVEEYDPATDTWTKKANMPTAREAISTSVVNGKIYVTGGWDGARLVDISIVEEYDPATDTWTKKADMPTTKIYHATSAVNGKIYAIGGRAGGRALSRVDEYDPATDTWTMKTDMPTAREKLSTSVVNGKIYVIGGMRFTAPGTFSLFTTVEEYDPVADTWTEKPPMPTARYDFSACAVNGRVYVIGGITETYAPLSIVEEYYTGFVPVPTNVKAASWGELKVLFK